MKIVDVAEFYSPDGGGVRTYMHQKMAAGRALGHDVVIVAPGRERRTERRDGGRIEYIPAQTLIVDPRYGLFWNFRHVHALLDAERPDVVEASSPWTASWIVAAWRGPAAKVHFLHADPVGAHAYRWFGRVLRHGTIDRLCHGYWLHLRALARRYDATVMSGEWLARRVRDHGVPNVVTASFGVDTTRFSPALRDPALRRDLLAHCGLGEDAMLLLGVGRIQDEKRWPLVMRASQDPSLPRKAAFVHVGEGVDRRIVERVARALPHVRLLGPVREPGRLARIYASADALMHGSGTETFGLVIAEGMASGLPFVAPNGFGAADLAHPDHAELFRPDSRRDAVRALGRLMTRDRAEMSAAAVRAAARLGTPRDHFERLFAVYAELSARKRRFPGQIAVAAEPPAVGERAAHPA
jgi:alpha-1,6-mannosyltransferase